MSNNYNSEKPTNVWDPPIKKSVSNNNNAPKKVEKKSYQPPSSYQSEYQPNINVLRNYEKPWKEPEKKPTEGKGKSLDPSKSAFLLHHYPDGKGPDAELIEMLEKEVVDTNPCVKFDDIAELDNAKGILKEAVLLPILLPDYFKVLL